MSPLAKMWSLVVLLPLVPVILLYLIFEKQNYFELTSTAKGIVAMGPIAAYVALVLIVWRIYKKMSPLFATHDTRLEELCGDWSFKSTSRDGNVRVGDCFIRCERGQLQINGSFKDNDKTVGTWECELAGVRDNNLLMVYELRAISDGEDNNLHGLVKVPFGTATTTEMSGIWTVVGRDNMEGTITYTRKTKS